MQNKITVTLTGETVFEIFDQMKAFMTCALLNPKALPKETVDHAMTNQMQAFDFTKNEIETNYDKDDADHSQPEKEPGQSELKAAGIKPKRTRKPKETASVAPVGADTDLSGQKQPSDVSGKREAPTVVVASKEAVHQALQQVNMAAGLNKAREILAHFKIQRISEIKPEQYKEFVDMCNVACNAQASASTESMFQ